MRSGARWVPDWIWPVTVTVPIRSAETTAPGFSMGNVHVMAGVPRIMRAGNYGKRDTNLTGALGVTGTGPVTTVPLPSHG